MSPENVLIEPPDDNALKRIEEQELPQSSVPIISDPGAPVYQSPMYQPDLSTKSVLTDFVSVRDAHGVNENWRMPYFVYTHSATMSVATQRGIFDKLPYELRLQVWETALSDGSTNIMSTSRVINEEISFMPTNVHRLDIKSPKEKTNYASNDDNGSRDIYGGFLGLPFEKLKVVVKIYAPDPQDGAQLILLWHKVRALIAILNQTRGPKAIEIALQRNGKHSWHWDSSVTAGLTSRLTDSNLLLVAFGQLHNTHNITVTPSSLVLGQYKNLDARIADIDFFFDTQLDTLRGRAASMLRLERFATWFSSPWGNLPYEDQTLITILRYHCTVAAYDPKLTKLRLRYNCFDTLQLGALGRDTFHPIDCDFD
ncbi:hypothetical protein BJX64DRAFT_293095 [Aspergillus heterothallicus]